MGRVTRTVYQIYSLSIHSIYTLVLAHTVGELIRFTWGGNRKHVQLPRNANNVSFKKHHPAACDSRKRRLIGGSVTRLSKY